jgi:hypothetical protein
LVASKIKVQPASRVGIEPLIGMAEQLLTRLPGWVDAIQADSARRFPSPLALDVHHLARHDPAGLLTVSIGEDVVGLGIAYVRSRQLHVAQLWVLPEYEDHAAVHALLRRMFAYGERAAVQDCIANVLADSHQQALLFRFGLRPRFPVYRFVLGRDRARQLGGALAASLPGSEVSGEMISHRGWVADPERLDRLARGVVRPMDHEYWLTQRGLRMATVRQGRRIAAYAYGGHDQCGPVTASTGDAALAALGWALQLAATEGETVQLLVPAVFDAAVETLLEAGGECRAVSQWMSRVPTSGMERYVLSGITLL